MRRRTPGQAHAFRISGYALLAAGRFGSVVAAGAIAGGGTRARRPPASRELDAVQRYNRYAFATGACVAPR